MKATELADRFSDLIADVETFKREHGEDPRELALGNVECGSMLSVLGAHVNDLGDAAIQANS